MVTSQVPLACDAHLLPQSHLVEWRSGTRDSCASPNLGREKMRHHHYDQDPEGVPSPSVHISLRVGPSQVFFPSPSLENEISENKGKESVSSSSVRKGVAYQEKHQPNLSMPQAWWPPAKLTRSTGTNLARDRIRSGSASFLTCWK